MSLRAILCVLVLVSGSIPGTVGQVNSPRQLGNKTVILPWATGLYIHPNAVDPTEKYSLIMSTFNPVPQQFTPNYFYRYLGKYLDNVSGAQQDPLYSFLTMPYGTPSQNPESVFGFPTISQPDGFSYTFKDEGTIYIHNVTDLDNPLTYDIGRSGSYWFQQVAWRDVNGDGLQDIVTCRSALFNPPQMVWLEQPASNPLTSGSWATRPLTENVCDGRFAIATVSTTDGDFDGFFSAGNLTETLAVTWSQAPNQLWDNPDLLQTRILDTGSRFYWIEVTDLNLDGRPELLVTKQASFDGSVVVYEIPDDFRTGIYIAHELAAGFDTIGADLVPGLGAPGEAIPFYPDVSTQAGKPWIHVTGQDDGSCYTLYPNSQDPADWSYTVARYFQEQETVTAEGLISTGNAQVADLDGDGWSEVMFASYYPDRLYVYSYSPEP